MKKLGIDPASLDDADAKRLMLDEPRLLKRPILKAGRTLLVGFKAKEWEAALLK